MYIFPLFVFFWGLVFRPDHFVFTWDVQTLAIVYMTFVVFMDGFGFLLWLCVSWLCVWMYVYGCVRVCVWGYVYGYRVSILREAWFNKYRGLPLLGARFHHHWDLLASRGPFLSSLELTRFSRPAFYHRWDLLSSQRPISSSLGLTPSRGPNDSPNFSNFSRQKWKNLPQYAMSNKFF
jgi:hypothetical protein